MSNLKHSKPTLSVRDDGGFNVANGFASVTIAPDRITLRTSVAGVAIELVVDSDGITQKATRIPDDRI